MRTDNTEWLPAWEDPDAPFRGPTTAPAGTPPPTDPQTHRWRRRLLIAGISALALIVLLVGAGYVYYRWRFSQIHKQRIAGLAPDSGTFNVLLVGSDSRANVEGNSAFNDKSAPVTGQRSDTIMVLHADTRQKKAMILSIPRDLYVPIAGTTGSNRVNTAFDDGAQRLVDTIQTDLGIKINHYVQVDFVGFQAIVNSVNGVDIYVPAPARDKLSGLDIKTAGCAHLDGFQALAWARSRHFEEYEGGRWQSDPTGDLGRIQRQQDFIRRMLRKALATRNPIKVNELIGDGIKNVTIDQEMSSSDILRLAGKFRSLNADTVDMATLPTTPFTTRIGGLTADVLRLKQPDAQTFIDRVNGITPPPAPPVTPANTRVRVLNGTGQSGLAAQVSVALQGPGFSVADRGDASGGRASQTLIRYAPGALDKAELLQRYLQSAPRLVSDPSLRTVDIALVVGSDYTGVRDTPAPVAPSTTPTTVAGKGGPTTTIAPC
ncbi:MAG: LCP family protein [Acidimicrobiia bacterium]|nr:LCP family protein [Acidimicrobiia bacterium]